MIKQKINLTTFLTVSLIISVAASAIFMAKLIGAKLEFPKKQQKIITDNSQLSIPAPVIDNTIKFDVEKVKIGDKLGNMTVTKLNGIKSETPTINSALVNFKGRTEVTGKIQYHEPGGFMAEAVCLGNLNKESLAKMPKMESDTREIWFCFNDLEGAKKKRLHTTTELVTVLIDNYSIVYYPSEVYNTADLISVITP